MIERSHKMARPHLRPTLPNLLSAKQRTTKNEELTTNFPLPHGHTPLTNSVAIVCRVCQMGRIADNELNWWPAVWQLFCQQYFGHQLGLFASRSGSEIKLWQGNSRRRFDKIKKCRRSWVRFWIVSALCPAAWLSFWSPAMVFALSCLVFFLFSNHVLDFFCGFIQRL